MAALDNKTMESELWFVDTRGNLHVNVSSESGSRVMNLGLIVGASSVRENTGSSANPRVCVRLRVRLGQGDSTLYLAMDNLSMTAKPFAELAAEGTLAKNAKTRSLGKQELQRRNMGSSYFTVKLPLMSHTYLV